MPISSDHKSPKREVTWTPKEVDEACAGTRLPWLRTLIRFLFESGMRIGDALELRWGYVRGDHIEWPQEKNRTQSAVPLSDLAQAILASWKPAGAKEGDLVFPGELGQPRAYRNVLRALYKALGHKKGERGRGFHDLRRTLATELHNLGEADELIAPLLGQKTTTMVPVYRATRAEALRAVLDRRASILASISNSPSGQVIHSAGSTRKQGNKKARRRGGP